MYRWIILWYFASLPANSSFVVQITIQHGFVFAALYLTKTNTKTIHHQPCFLKIFLLLQINCQYTIWILVTQMTRSDDSYVIRRYQSRNGKQITFASKVQSTARNFHSLLSWFWNEIHSKRNIVDTFRQVIVAFVYECLNVRINYHLSWWN